MNNNNRCSRLQSFIAGVFLMGIATSAHAALVSRLNGQAVYDTDLNITWLADANLAASNTFGVAGIGVQGSPGSMDWYAAQSWIGAMNAANYFGYSDWRLPTSDTCSGYSCTGSEMGHLFYNELGGTAVSDITTTHNSNYNLFHNLGVKNYIGGSTSYYWSGTQPYTDSAWTFDFDLGSQIGIIKGYGYPFALVVRPGDVTAVPIPAAFWLFGSGLVGLFGFARRWSNRIKY